MKSLDGQAVLVTGASGFIGSHLARRLSEVSGIRLFLLSRQPEVSEYSHVQWLQGSLNDLTSKYWRQNGIARIDTVFHLGAFTPKVVSDANHVERVFDDNLFGTRTLLGGLPTGVQRFIFSSTLDVYGSIKGEGMLTETSSVQPSGLYAASKLFCEQLVSVWAAQHNCMFAILRYGHIFGPGEGAYGKLIPQVIKSLLKNESPIIYGDGSARRDFLFVGDAVEATIRAAISRHEKIGSVNVVRGHAYSVRDIVRILSDIVGSSVAPTYDSSKSNGTSLVFKNDKMLDVLGSWNFISMQEGLQQEVAYFESLQ
ncbi:MAG: NAD-dependent epimerase/dehydratase family protein [Mariprofundaceae bacterium]|nr:NAD-dependent epimerase/dehydratase family protein [Mariprofundaceae bacterium]